MSTELLDLIELPVDAPQETPVALDPRMEFIAGLRELVDWYEAHPECRPPHSCSVDLFAHSKEEFIEMRRQAGCQEKATVGDWMIFRKDFRGNVRIDINISKENTCERVKVGTRIIPAQPARVIELEAAPEKVEDVYEWKCPEAILEQATT